MPAEQERKTPAQMFPEWFAETEGPNAWAYTWRGRFAEIYHEWLALQAELQAAQERKRALRKAIDRMLSEIGEPNADYAAPIAEAYWIGQEVLNGPQTQPAQRTEEPSDDEGLEPIETSPLTEREPDL